MQFNLYVKLKTRNDKLIDHDLRLSKLKPDYYYFEAHDKKIRTIHFSSQSFTSINGVEVEIFTYKSVIFRGKFCYFSIPNILQASDVCFVCFLFLLCICPLFNEPQYHDANMSSRSYIDVSEELTSITGCRGRSLNRRPFSP